MAIGAISYTGDLLVVHVQRNRAALCYHSNDIDLAQTPVNSRTGAGVEELVA